MKRASDKSDFWSNLSENIAAALADPEPVPGLFAAVKKTHFSPEAARDRLRSALRNALRTAVGNVGKEGMAASLRKAADELDRRRAAPVINDLVEELLPKLN